MQQKFLNPNAPNNESFYFLQKHWILYNECIARAVQLKGFVLLKFRDYTKLNLLHLNLSPRPFF